MWCPVTPTFDSNFNASQWLSIIGFVFGAAAWFTLSCSCLCRIDKTRLKGVACYFWIACFFQGMSLLMFRSTACNKGFFAKYFDLRQCRGRCGMFSQFRVRNGRQCHCSLFSLLNCGALLFCTMVRRTPLWNRLSIISIAKDKTKTERILSRYHPQHKDRLLKDTTLEMFEEREHNWSNMTGTTTIKVTTRIRGWIKRKKRRIGHKIIIILLQMKY